MIINFYHAGPNSGVHYTREYETINGSSTVDFLKQLEAVNPLATKIHIIADAGKAHTGNEVQLFLSKSTAVNRLYLAETCGVDLPNNSVKLLSKKLRFNYVRFYAKSHYYSKMLQF